MSETQLIETRPGQVPPELVVDFDLWNIPGAQDDVQLAAHAFQQRCPDIFWSPRNGGHWVATRAADIETMQRDHGRFSHHCFTIPKKPEDMPRELPSELDPPRHTPLRRPLTAALMPKIVYGLDDQVRSLSAALVDGFRDRGHCEFIAEFGEILPITVFLDFVNLPPGDRHFLLPKVARVVRGSTPEIRHDALLEVIDYITGIVRERRARPGEDMLSAVVNAIELDGQRINEPDAVAYAGTVLFGGLDTVTAMLSFVARFLARSPAHRRQLVARLDDEAYMRNAVEELLRRHGIASTARLITHDMDYNSAPFRGGEMVLVLNMLHGLDERRFDRPLTVDFDRPAPISHAIFGNGPHTCPGAVLARRELRIFLQEWLRRIPEFEVTPGTVPVTTTGLVSGITRLELSWPA
jgi:cytochrome P450